jgi:hypothetical protein
LVYRFNNLRLLFCGGGDFHTGFAPLNAIGLLDKY